MDLADGDNAEACSQDRQRRRASWSHASACTGCVRAAGLDALGVEHFGLAGKRAAIEAAGPSAQASGTSVYTARLSRGTAV